MNSYRDHNEVSILKTAAKYSIALPNTLLELLDCDFTSMNLHESGTYVC